MINEKVEDRICGWGPTLDFYLVKDETLFEDKKKLFAYFDTNYDASSLYIKRLEPVREFYAEDLLVSAADVQKETGNYLI